MKKSKHNPEPLILEEGYFLDKHFDNYEMLNESAKNWSYNCTYQLKPNALSGRHRILQLSTMQLGYAVRSGGHMHDAYAAQGHITVAVIESCQDKACFHRTKLHKGDIIFFDDSQPYSFLSNEEIRFVVVNIPTQIFQSHCAGLSQTMHHTIRDTDDVFLNLVNNIWTTLTQESAQKRESQVYKELETEIFSTLKILLKTQTPVIPKLTKGEKTVLDIRNQVYLHMDGQIDITSLAKQHNVSVRTLQISFKSLFGFSPTVFLRNMKLNLVYRDLKFADTETEKVSSIAQKWGFMHMGHFSKYYTELFGENPSQTLKTAYKEENSMVGECVERQEEML